MSRTARKDDRKTGEPRKNITHRDAPKSMGGSGHVTSLRLRPRVLLSLSVLLMVVALPLMVHSAAAQTPSECLYGASPGCTTGFSVSLSGGAPDSDVTYSWNLSNPCGDFVVNPNFPDFADWTYGSLTGCANLNGTITVDIKIVINSGTYLFTCVDPNGASAASLTLAGPEGLVTCTANPDNPPQRGPAVDQYGVAGFYAQFSYGQGGSGEPSTTEAESSETATGSTSTPLPMFIEYAAFVAIVLAFVVTFGLVKFSGFAFIPIDPPPPGASLVPLSSESGTAGDAPPTQITGLDRPEDHDERIPYAKTKADDYWAKIMSLLLAPGAFFWAFPLNPTFVDPALISPDPPPPDMVNIIGLDSPQTQDVM